MDEQWENNVKLWMKEHQIETIDLNLIKDALTHSSYKGMGYNVRDNERLEFLGDAVLDLVLADRLIKNPKLSEGQMTEIRKANVNNEYLSIIYNILKIEDIIRTANDFNVSDKVKAGFVEALFGVVFLNKGYERCNELWNEIIAKTHIDDIIINRKYSNPKGTLIELFQKHNLEPPVFKTVKIGGHDHSPVFECVIQVYYNGIDDEVKEASYNKKSAEKYAAVEMLKKLGEWTYLN